MSNLKSWNGTQLGEYIKSTACLQNSKEKDNAVNNLNGINKLY